MNLIAVARVPDAALLPVKARLLTQMVLADLEAIAPDSAIR